MEAVLLIDYGSTYTKVAAVDVKEPRLLGSASSYTTVASTVREGLENALAELKRQTGKLEFHKQLACSSAAGGLRMVTSGLVPELTAKAASIASMGAGAKIVGLYSHELIEDDVAEIAVTSPDILLLTGGTDGGNKTCILHNAKMLADAPGDFPIIVAGNRNSGREVMQILANRRAYLCDNVMPTIGALNIEPARQLIREIFLERIVHAKGLDSAVSMPTPSAVLAAAELLATDMGDLIAIDVGGATTDVYSIANGTPSSSGVIYKGLAEPFAKRTVEGDIGMRYSVQGIIEAAGISKVAMISGLSTDTDTVETAGISKIAMISGLSVDTVTEHVKYLTEHTDTLPKTTEQKNLDFALAAMAINTATLRHAGSLEEVYTTSGRALVQAGKDLTNVQTLIMTGGALLSTDRQTELAAYALFSESEPQSLRPKKASIFIDDSYILAAMGLLSGYAPEAALEIMKTNIREVF